MISYISQTFKNEEWLTCVFSSCDLCNRKRTSWGLTLFLILHFSYIERSNTWDYGSQFAFLKGSRFIFPTFFSRKFYRTALGNLCFIQSQLIVPTVGISVSKAEASLTGGRKWLQREFWVLLIHSNSTKATEVVLFSTSLFLGHKVFYID